MQPVSAMRGEIGTKTKQTDEERQMQAEGGKWVEVQANQKGL